MVKNPPVKPKRSRKMKGAQQQADRPKNAPLLPKTPFNDDEIEFDEEVGPSRLPPVDMAFSDGVPGETVPGDVTEPSAVTSDVTAVSVTHQDHDYLSHPAPHVPCNVCGVKFKDYNGMASHRASNHKNWRICAVCKVQFRNAKELAAHMEGECGHRLGVPALKANSQYSVNCRICYESFKNTLEIAEHNRVVHGIIVKFKFVCPLCKATFASNPKLKVHCSKHHEMQKSVWLPKIKDKSCRRRYKHKLKDSTPTVVPPALDVEEEVIVPKIEALDPVTALRNLDVKLEPPELDQLPQSEPPRDPTPEEVCTGEIQDEYGGVFDSPCHYCNTGVNNRTIRVGSIQCDIVMRRDLQCHMCGEFLKTKMALTHHLKSHTVKQLICDQCEKCFNSKKVLQNHIRVKHKNHSQEGKSPSSSPEKTGAFVCHCCRRGFSLEIHLIMHYSSYAKRKFNQCSYCSQRFVSAVELKQHDVVHKHEDAPYSCQLCVNKKFRRMITLHRHRTSAHVEWDCSDFYLSSKSEFDLMRANDDTDKASVADSTATDNMELKAEIPESPDTKARKSLVSPAKGSARSEQDVADIVAQMKEECTYCWDLFKDKQALNVHLSIHKMENEPYKCPECYQSFAWKNDRRRHRYLYHGVPLPTDPKSGKDEEKIEKVPPMAKKAAEDTSQPSKFSQTIVQLDEKCWQCCTCEKTYKNRVSANVHATKCRKNALARMHRKKSLQKKKLAAEQMSAVVEQKDPDQLENVAEDLHKEKEENRVFKNLLNKDLDTLKARFEHKPIQCACCFRVFKNNFSLSRHVNYMVSHWCKLCGGLYKKLAVHQETKHGRQYKATMCLQCGAVFETQTSLNEHIIEEHAKAGSSGNNELKSVEEIKMAAVSEKLASVFRKADDDSKSSVEVFDTREPDVSENESKSSFGRTLHDLIDDSDIPDTYEDYFNKKVVYGSNFLLSSSDPNSRRKESIGSRNSFKNQAKKMKRRNSQQNEKVKTTRRGRKTPSQAVSDGNESGSASDKNSARVGPRVVRNSRSESMTDDGISIDDEEAIDYPSDFEVEKWTGDDEEALVAALEAQYSAAVLDYESVLLMEDIAKAEKEMKISQEKSKKRRQLKYGISDSEDEKFSPVKKRDLDDGMKNRRKRKHSKSEEISDYDESVFTRDSSDEEFEVEKKSKKRKKMRPDLIPLDEEDDVSGLKKFKIPRKSPKKRSKTVSGSSVEDETMPEAKRSRTEKKLADKLKTKINPKTLSLWQNMGTSKGPEKEEKTEKKKPVAKKSLKNTLVAPEPQTITLYETGELASESTKNDYEEKKVERPAPKAKARKTIHGARRPAERTTDPRSTSSDLKRSVDKTESSYQSKSFTDRGSEESSIGSRTPSEGGRTPGDHFTSEGGLTPSEGGRTPSDIAEAVSENRFSSPKARKSSHGTSDPRSRFDDRHSSDWRSDGRNDADPRRSDYRDDRSRSNSSDRRLERSDSRNRDPHISPRGSRDEFGRPRKLHRTILLDTVPDTKPDRDIERRKATEALKRDKNIVEPCRICGEQFTHKWELFLHLNEIHNTGPKAKLPANMTKPERFDRRFEDRPGPARNDRPNIDQRDFDEDRSDRRPDRFDEENTHKCSFCPATFPDRVSRSNHLLREHSAEVEEPRRMPQAEVPQYPCTECWKQFVSQRGLELHMANKHGISPPAERPPQGPNYPPNPYDYTPPRGEPGFTERRPRARMGSSFRSDPRTRCTICGMNFPDRPSLQVHLRTHPRQADPDPRRNQGPPEPGTMTCRDCFGHFPSFGALKQHRCPRERPRPRDPRIMR